MNRITKDNGLVEYSNQASVLKMKDGGTYTEIYPKELDTGVVYNKNTLTYNNRHIELNGDTVAEAFDDLKDRINTTGRVFNMSVLEVPEDFKIKKVLKHKNIYYVLCTHPSENSKIYYSSNLFSWSLTIAPKQYNDITFFAGDIYATYLASDGLSIDKVDFVYERYERCFIDSTLTYRYDSDILIGSDKSSILVFTKHNDGYAIISGQFTLADGQWNLAWNISNVSSAGLPSSTAFPYNKMVNAGNGFYYVYYDKLLWTIKNGIYYGAISSSLGISNYIPSSNKVYMNSNNETANCYDMIYTNGRYIGNGYDNRIGKPVCFCGYTNLLIASDGISKRILDQPLMRLTHAGSYIFGVGYDDGKLYYSQVK